MKILYKSTLISFILIVVCGCTMNTTIVKGEGNTTRTHIEKETGVSTQASDLIKGVLP